MTLADWGILVGCVLLVLAAIGDYVAYRTAR